MAKVKAGEIVCDRCAREVVVKEADSGSLSYTCQHCDFRGYAPAMTEGKRLLIDEMGKRGGLAPPPAAVPAASGSASPSGTLPKAEPAKQTSGLLMG